MLQSLDFHNNISIHFNKLGMNIHHYICLLMIIQSFPLFSFKLNHLNALVVDVGDIDSVDDVGDIENIGNLVDFDFIDVAVVFDIV